MWKQAMQTKVVNSHKLTILAQDPTVRHNGRMVTARVDVPAETLAEGPCGSRIKVVDFDATSDRLYAPHKYARGRDAALVDPFAPPEPDRVGPRGWRAYEKELLGNPNFHAQNAYAIAMRTLARFEFALGRRVSWGFPGHQLHIAPHAFCEANAYYSERDHALLFGYFRGRSGAMVFTSLSHDVVAHETTHALLDGLRDGFTEPSGYDQDAFHEGFADVVALLSVFSLEAFVRATLAKDRSRRRGERWPVLVPWQDVSRAALAGSILFGLGEQVGQQMEGINRNALRTSVLLPPRRDYLGRAEYAAAHTRGEVLVAAFLNAFLDVWDARIEQNGRAGARRRNLNVVVEEGAKAASHLLTIAIRALDYCPPVDITFAEYLSALLTADRETAPDDLRYDYRGKVLASFRRYGIDAAKHGTDPRTGMWRRSRAPLNYGKVHFESMLRDKEEVFRFIWENRDKLGVDERGYIEVNSVRPSTRVSPDGFVLRETICEYVQTVRLFGSELPAVLRVARPPGMATTQSVTAVAGGTLVFDQYGRVKYHIAHHLSDKARQARRIAYLWQQGYIERPRDDSERFASLHRARALSGL